MAAHAVLLAAVFAILLHASADPVAALGRWDGIAYRQISRYGYETHLLYSPNGVPQEMRIAFFPLFPYLVKLVAFPLGGSTLASGILVSTVAALVASVGIYRVLRGYISDRAALLVVALWAAAPTAYLESMVYTESLFTALSVFALIALIRHRWLTASALTILAGLTRSTVVLVIAVVVAAALIAIIRRRDGWRPYAAIVLSPLGIVGYWAFLGLRLHHLNAWFISQEAPGWRSSFDFGRQTVKVVVQQLTFSQIGSAYRTVLLISIAILAPLLVSTILLVRDRTIAWQLSAWSAATVVFTLLSSGAFTSKPRFLLPCFPLLIPAAKLLAKTRLYAAIPIIAVLAVLGGWVGAYFVHWANAAP
ncbi:glycosyltransferase family 39 protein [Actinocrinis sp.]|uniref:glycosyltransferase family 39 protein n=1 Tax=Actinocrinis sp. TaxID=1920516 RepID=UPI002D5B7F57|nr:hypothetical protein [Actinocrinis sp.]HZP53710.1 hypothetical protein [Actinocrinis sp.]